MFSLRRTNESGVRDSRQGPADTGMRGPRARQGRREPGRSGRELFAKYRRVLAGAAAMLAVATSLAALAPETEERVRVLVAGRDLPAGTLLADSDLALAPVSRSLLPAGGFGTTEPVAGSRLAIPLLAGSPLLGTMLIGPGLLAGTPPGTVAVPLRLDDAQTATLLRAGQRVDVVLTEGNGFETSVTSRVLARGLAVLWTGAQPDAAQQGPWGASGSGDEAGLIVVAAGSGIAESLSAAPQRGKLAVVLVNP
ncbi:Flp pilus assembly protein CpaB [Paeniglutamicibacter sp. NPDC012692]|uniref:Flp pilus assembly protein CpaB n=1 Tax=Paeniglutamicibacter sp. NPDC012692 TaxID=3364388 RepID=UPI0036A4E612